MNTNYLCVVLLSTLLLVGCGGGRTTPGEASEETIKAADGVKWIAAHVEKGDDKSTWGQRTYPISTQERLMVHYQGLLPYADKVSVQKPVYLRVQVSDSAQLAEAKAHLRVCPINRSWSMLASWKAVSPFPGEEWPDGGDLEQADCVSADNTDVIKAIEACKEPEALCFDLSVWFKRYLIEKGVDYGVSILTFSPGVSIRVYGDGSNSRGPRFHWTAKSGTIY